MSAVDVAHLMTDGGTILPPIGYGTSQPDNDDVAASVRHALESGYRHVDTAQDYDTEVAVREAIAASSVDREDVFLATKVSPTNLAHDDVLDSTERSLERLGVDTVDLLYVHWPTEAYDPEGTLSAFDDLVDRGVVRHVGVSNFTPTLLREANDVLDAPIFAHQIECHPLCPQDDIREVASEMGHHLVAYSPLAHGHVMDQPTIVDVAEAYDVSPAQVSLAWLRAKDVCPIPKAASPGHIEDNYESLSLNLDADAIARIDAIEERYRKFDFDWAPWNRA